MDENLLALGTRLRLLLNALDGGVQAAYDAAGVEFRPRYYAITRHLLDHGATSVGELASLLGVSQPAITQTLGEMRDSGLVLLVIGEDKRSRRAQLTPAARKLCDSLTPIWTAAADAAAELERALPAPLGAVVDATLRELRREPFDRRIAAQLEKY